MRLSLYISAVLVACVLVSTAHAQMPAFLNCDAFHLAITYCSGSQINLMQHMTAWCGSCCYNQPDAETGWVTSPFTVRSGYFIADYDNIAIRTAVKDTTRLAKIWLGVGAVNYYYSQFPETPNSVRQVSNVWDSWYRSVQGLNSDGYSSVYTRGAVNTYFAITGSGSAGTPGLTTLPYFGDNSGANWGSLGSWSVRDGTQPNYADDEGWAGTPNGLPNGCFAGCTLRKRDDGMEEVIDNEGNIVEVRDPATVVDVEEAAAYVESEETTQKEARFYMATCKTWWSNRGRDATCLPRVLAFYSRGTYSSSLGSSNWQFTNQANTVPGPSAAPSPGPNGINTPAPMCYKPVVPNYETGYEGSYNVNNYWTGSNINSGWSPSSYQLDICLDNMQLCHCCWQNWAHSSFPSFDFVMGPGALIDTTSGFDDGTLTSGSGAG